MPMQATETPIDLERQCAKVTGSGANSPKPVAGCGPTAPAHWTCLRSCGVGLRQMVSHQSPVRLLIFICLAILVAHPLAMALYSAGLTVPHQVRSLVESVLLLTMLFPMLYLFSFRPLLQQISERCRAEEVMRESESKYRHLFEHLSDAAFLVDVQTDRVLDANKQAERLLARTRAELLGANQGVLYAPEKAEEYRRKMTRFAGEFPATDFEGEVLRKDGQPVSVHFSAAPFVLYGRRLVVSLVHDMTERRKLQAQLFRAQRLESLGALAGGIAHDLNNVLATILISIELLRANSTDAASRRILETIETSARRC